MCIIVQIKSSYWKTRKRDTTSMYSVPIILVFKCNTVYTYKLHQYVHISSFLQPIFSTCFKHIRKYILYKGIYNKYIHIVLPFLQCASIFYDKIWHGEEKGAQLFLFLWPCYVISWCHSLAINVGQSPNTLCLIIVLTNFEWTFSKVKK